jgi:hypothetical protein
VVEPLFAGGAPRDEVVFAALMLRVAPLTGAFCLGNAPVEPFPFVQLRDQLAMAAETLRLGKLFPRFMAGGALRDAFEFGVRFRQFPWREEVCARHKRKKQSRCE